MAAVQHAAWQVPNAPLQAIIVAGTEAPRVAPQVKPAAAYYNPRCKYLSSLFKSSSGFRGFGHELCSYWTL